MDAVALYTVAHLVFESAREYDNPLWDAQGIAASPW